MGRTHHESMTYSALDRRRLAVAADCDPRTIRRVELGLPIKPTTERRIRRACAELAIQIPVPSRERPAA